MEKILLIGQDFGLLSSRAAVLSRTKAAVTCCYPHEFMQLRGDNVDVDLVVLCHSLNADLRQGITQDVRARWPEAPILQVTTDLYGDTVDGYDADVVSTSDPPQLIRQVTALLVSKPARRKGARRPPGN